MPEDKFEVVFPKTVPLTLQQKHKYEVRKNLIMLFRRAAENLDQEVPNFLLLSPPNLKGKVVFAMRPETAKKFGLPFHKLESDCPWDIHAKVAAKLAEFIPTAKIQ